MCENRRVRGNTFLAMATVISLGPLVIVPMEKGMQGLGDVTLQSLRWLILGMACLPLFYYLAATLVALSSGQFVAWDHATLEVGLPRVQFVGADRTRVDPQRVQRIDGYRYR